MVLSDLSIKRPVVCLVASIIIVLVGYLAFLDLPVREYPEVDSPVISISTNYPGASAEVVESRITEILEKEVSAIDGIHIIRSSSSEESSNITLEFNVDRNIDEAANDVRDKVGRVRGRLPVEVDDSRIVKADPDAQPIISLSFNSDRHSRLELTEMVERFAVQRVQTVPGVASASVNGARFAIRIWVSSDRLAAYGLTVTDIDRALRAQNVDVPSGRIESVTREFPVRLKGRIDEAPEFEKIVVATRGGYQVKLSDVARVELGADDYRNFNYFNGRPNVGLQVLRQSRSNLLDVANGVKAQIPLIQADLPEGVRVDIASDSSLFVERSVSEVKRTLWEASILVILMIFIFLRDWRATVIPLLAIPVSIIGSFAIMSVLGFTINNLTLLALVLAIGLVVDDAIVMLENIYRRVELGEEPIHAAIFGARQVAFAIIATTLTLAAVFLPVAFQKGQTGRLFYEFGVTLAVSVLVSAFVALTLTPMLCSRMLRLKIVDGHTQHGWFYRVSEPFFLWLNRSYGWLLRGALQVRALVLLVALLFACAGPWLYTKLQRELTPLEDRGTFNANFTPPDGSTPEYNAVYSRQMEQMLLALPEIERTSHRTGDGRGMITATLKPWEQRTRKTQAIVQEMQDKFAGITGGQAVANPVRGLGGGGGGGGRGGGGGSGAQLVLQGSDFDRLQELGNEVLGIMADNSAMFTRPRVSPSPTKPQLDLRIDRAKAADMRVSIADVASTLETLLGGRRLSQFQRGNQQYDVILQTDGVNRATPSDLGRLYVKSSDGAMVQLSNLVSYTESVVPTGFPHFNRLRSVTVSGQISGSYTIGDAIDYLSPRVREIMPAGYTFTWDGEGRQFVESTSDTSMLFGLALLFTFLILAAQFESWIHPITIFTGVVLAVSGGLIVLYCTRWWGPAMTDNLFAQFGVIMLIGMVAKNGILIVEFANQLQVDGKNAFDAAYMSATIRFRPILMTSIATVLGAVPIAFATGAGAESRNPMGIVVVGGLTIATFLTLFVVPIVYILMDRMCMKFTGKSSAHGLIKAEQIERETQAGESVPAPAH